MCSHIYLFYTEEHGFLSLLEVSEECTPPWVKSSGGVPIEILSLDLGPFHCEREYYKRHSEVVKNARFMH